MTKPDLAPFDALYHLMWGFAGQRVVSVAARSGLLSELAGGWATTAELAHRTGLDPLATGKVVRALVAAGVAEADEDRYRLPSQLAPAFAAGDGNLSAFVDHIDSLNDQWGRTLEEWLRTGTQPRRERDPEGARRFGAAMRANANVLAPQVLEALGLDGVGQALDIGGGVGRYAELLCAAAPDLRCTVLDRSDTVELGKQALADTTVADRVSFVAGDYHDADLGEGYDLVLLANILHQEKADAAAALVARAAGALAPGGRLAVIDFVIDTPIPSRRSVGGCSPPASRWSRPESSSRCTGSSRGEDRPLRGRMPHPLGPLPCRRAYDSIRQNGSQPMAG